jgi:hypothetical protein
MALMLLQVLATSMRIRRSLLQLFDLKKKIPYLVFNLITRDKKKSNERRPLLMIVDFESMTSG